MEILLWYLEHEKQLTENVRFKLYEALEVSLKHFSQEMQFANYLKEESSLVLILHKKLQGSYEQLPCPIVTG